MPDKLIIIARDRRIQGRISGRKLVRLELNGYAEAITSEQFLIRRYVWDWLCDGI
ncbi:MAG: hypothetical protein P4M02_11740 [Clostridia bacterium]|nr:hypothetical protein [Clostridia bacterium]